MTKRVLTEFLGKYCYRIGDTPNKGVFNDSQLRQDEGIPNRLKGVIRLMNLFFENKITKQEREIYGKNFDELVVCFRMTILKAHTSKKSLLL